MKALVDHGPGSVIRGARPCRGRALGVTAAVGYLCARRWFLNWGARKREVAARLPGDELIVSPTLCTTRAITIEAPPDNVWPWLDRIGKAGLTIVEVEPARRLVMVVGEPASTSWAFVLRPLGADRTRLLVRLRANFGIAAVLPWLAARMLEPVHFVIERGLLLGVRAGSEQSYRGPADERRRRDRDRVGDGDGLAA